jgi:hypothetical protein
MNLSAVFLIGLALASPLVARAESPFDGRWKVDPAGTKWAGAGRAYLLKDRQWFCMNCAGVAPIAADGRPHAYRGAPREVDSLKVRILSDHHVQVEGLKGGRLFVRRDLVVSPDGATLTNEVDVAPLLPGAPPVKRRMELERVSAGPAGSHLISGTWRLVRMSAMSDDVATSIFHVEGDRIDWSTPAGVSYHAVFGGPPVPQIGDPDLVQVTVRRINDRQIVESDWKDGKLDQVFTLTVSEDGRRMTIAAENPHDGTVQTQIAYKQ